MDVFCSAGAVVWGVMGSFGCGLYWGVGLLGDLFLRDDLILWPIGVCFLGRVCLGSCC